MRQPLTGAVQYFHLCVTEGGRVAAASSPLTARRRPARLASMNERSTLATPHGEHSQAPAGSLQSILNYARQNYAQQFVTLEAHRARAGSLLAFAAVLVAISAGSAQRDAPSLFQAGGTVLVLASAVLFLIVSLGESLRYVPSRRTLARSDVTAPVRETHERLLRGTLDVLDFNHRILSRRLIGARVTGLLL